MAERDDLDLTEAFEEIIALEARLHLEEVDHLKRALVTNRRIGMAIGVLMGVHRITEGEAWARLVGTSRNSNRKLRDVAEDVVSAGDLPGS